MDRVLWSNSCVSVDGGSTSTSTTITNARLAQRGVPRQQVVKVFLETPRGDAGRA